MDKTNQMNQFCKYLPPSKQRKKKTNRRILPKQSKPGKSFLMAPGAQPKSFTIPKTKEPPIKPRKINSKEVNIFHIDSQIRKKLESKITTVPTLQQDLKHLLWIMQNGENSIDQMLARQKVSFLRKKIQDLETTLELGLYLFRTSFILDEYRSLISESGPRSFVSQSTDKRIDRDSLRRKELISHFLCIAQEYIEIDQQAQALDKIACEECGGLDFNFDEEHFIYVCKACGTEVEVLNDSPSFKDTDRVNMSSRFSYSRKGHFIDAMRKFQGVQNIDPKKISKVVSVLKEEIALHCLTSETVTKDHIYMFLSERRLSRHYEDLNLLYHIITSEPCPNISHLEDVLLEDFDRLEEKLTEVLEDERDNSLNVNYKMYKLLQRRGYPCRKDDFYILKTKTKEDEHDESMKTAWEKLKKEDEDRELATGEPVDGPSWEWIPTF